MPEELMVEKEYISEDPMRSPLQMLCRLTAASMPLVPLAAACTSVATARQPAPRRTFLLMGGGAVALAAVALSVSRKPGGQYYPPCLLPNTDFCPNGGGAP